MTSDTSWLLARHTSHRPTTRRAPNPAEQVQRQAQYDFYAPKDSSRGQLLEAKDHLQHMLAAIPLTEDERAAVDDGQGALDKLLGRLADIPTPAEPTPRQIGNPTTATCLPIVATTSPRR